MQDADDLRPGPATGPEHAVQGGERQAGRAGVDGVGQVPRRDGTGLAEERGELILVDGRALAVGDGEGLDQPGQPAEILAEMVAEPLGRPAGQADRRRP